jgi:hypothetical protein
MSALPAGAPVRYRTMGRGIVQEHLCPPERPCDDYVEPVHRYLVLFQTGRYRGTTRYVWVRDNEKLEASHGQ